MKNLFLFIALIFVTSCSSREEDSVTPNQPTDGYTVVTSFGSLAGMKYATYNGQNPATKVSFSSAGSGVVLSLSGTDYSQPQTYLKEGGYYLKINGNYAQIKLSQSVAYPASTTRKLITFTGFPSGSGAYEMQETP